MRMITGDQQIVKNVINKLGQCRKLEQKGKVVVSQSSVVGVTEDTAPLIKDNKMNPSKQKGNRLEREVVKVVQDAGFVGERAYASNGKSLGLEEDVDVKMTGHYVHPIDKTKFERSFSIQCKSRKTIANYIKPPESCNFTILKEDRGELLAVIPFKELLKLL